MGRRHGRRRGGCIEERRVEAAKGAAERHRRVGRDVGGEPGGRDVSAGQEVHGQGRRRRQEVGGRLCKREEGGGRGRQEGRPVGRSGVGRVPQPKVSTELLLQLQNAVTVIYLLQSEENFLSYFCRESELRVIHPCRISSIHPCNTTVGNDYLFLCNE